MNDDKDGQNPFDFERNEPPEAHQPQAAPNPPGPFEPYEPASGAQWPNDPIQPVVVGVARPVIVARPATLSDSIKLPQLSPAKAALNIFSIAAIFFAISVMIGVAIFPFVSEERLENDIQLLLLITVATGWLTLIIVLAGTRWFGFRPRQVGLLFRRNGADIALGLAVTAASFATFFITAGLLSAFWPAAFEQLQDNSEQIEKMIPHWHPLALFALMFAVACYEEFLFRGILLTHLRRLSGSWIFAVLLSSVLFALMHSSQEAAAAIPLFATALVWSGFTIWRRSIVPAIIGHALFNFIQLMALNYLQTAPTSQPTEYAALTVRVALALLPPW